MKKLLLATLVLALATPGLAGGLDASEQEAAPKKVAAVKAKTVKTTGYNLMHPFWGPTKGQFASDTNYKFTRTNYENLANDYAQIATEKLLYGLTDNWTLFGTIGRNWGKTGGDSVYRANHYKSDVWSLGTSYNFINDGKTFLQGAAEYIQSKNHDDGTGRAKEYSVQGLYGYNFDAFTPYVKMAYENSLNQGKKNDARYTATVAAYKQLTDKIGSTLGVEYAHPTASDYIKNSYTLTADTSYLITKDMALTVSGGYLLHEKTKSFNSYGHKNIKRQNRYSIGAGLKAAF